MKKQAKSAQVKKKGGFPRPSLFNQL